MEKANIVAGVYIERDGALLLRAELGKEDLYAPIVRFLDANQFRWNPSRREEAIRTLQYIGQLIGHTGQRLRSTSIACYGPFRSLKRTDEPSFGQLDDVRADPPLRGENLNELFHRSISNGGGNPNAFITVHTDANACALGEAYSRGWTSEEFTEQTLIYILVTHGIGLGIVQDMRILRTALHPEIGPLPVRYLGTDRLKPSKTENQYSRSLSLLAENRALFERFKLQYPSVRFSPEAVQNVGNDDFWDSRAYYLSQACLAATIILAPHQIVIGADLDPRDDLAVRTMRHFRNFVARRTSEGAPVFEYEEMTSDTFIAAPQPIKGLELPHAPKVTGAVGMCVAAAKARRGGPTAYRRRK